ncbi:MAG: glycosyltransferase family 4 protein [Verrucomicrobia bacterium]|nr:glycosyltransferase family 4 protein [Verrucomicrobiota bacterium]
MKRICFISLKSHDLVAEAAQPRYIGGAERQQVLIGRGLQQLGYEVSFVTHDVGQPDGVTHNGIRIHTAYHPDRGLPGLRAISPRWKGLWSALERADADIYHQMCADIETGQVAWWCRRKGRRLVFAAASDADCQRDLPLLRTRRQRWFYRYGLARADWVVCQTATQECGLKRHFDIQSMIIPSCTPEPEGDVNRPVSCPKAEHVTLAWVSRLVPLKRLEWLLDLAEHAPSYRFLVVGGGETSDAYVRGLLARAARLPNVHILGRVPDRELWEVYDQADLLLDTASIAGVPTTFLEAWARGVPVVTTVDPDGDLEKNNLGRVVSSVAEMAAAIAELIGQPERWWSCSQAARQYYKKHHTVRAISNAYHTMFHSWEGARNQGHRHGLRFSGTTARGQ